MKNFLSNKEKALLAIGTLTGNLKLLFRRKIES